jgi:hypothetical protein
LVPALACGHASSTAAVNPLHGVWAPTTYVLADGPTHGVTGQIFFAEERWTVLFFVSGEDGLPVRASAEGGRYVVDGDALTFMHDFHFSAGDAIEGMPASALRMEIKASQDAAREPTKLTLDGEQLTIAFPSGNAMTFKRLE